jgi:dCTP deaminase
MDVVFTDSYLEELIEKESISSSIADLDLKQHVQPSSIDIPLGEKAYLIKHKFLPFQKEIETTARDLAIDTLDLTTGANLLKGQTYLVPVLDVSVPEETHLRISPKSSIGRVDLFVRSVFDNYHYYDRVPSGAKGKLWLEITPQSYNVRVQSGLALSQLMVMHDTLSSTERLSDEALLYDDEGNSLENKWECPNRLLLSLNVTDDGLFGYEARPTNDVIDLSQTGIHDSDIFYRNIDLSSSHYTLEKDHFYILRTAENIVIPPQYSAEMIPFFHLVGELRAHYAGFFDPGFGYGKDGELKGSAGVLEIRPHETLTVYDKQPICLLEYYRNYKPPKTSYGFKGNHYQGQRGPKLAKFFK